ncbi:uncharacterized protein DUF1839 [Sphaerotilus hippei]|uniref:Uncharacterized protein DUF1839 n=1 Tax=Sphaerotilus hippei TaxID=744406 RepID=A0A318H3U6_9BURK|nr:DUF1839 family protein [Sphaerotilus hippei]PXW98130.1 uncharacterized protein DUF1839 [Sphaerotilus hippei]
MSDLSLPCSPAPAAAAPLCVIPGLDGEGRPPHELHRSERVWVEKNCYADLWIGLLGALGHEPAACLGFTLGIDFLGDQWTFYKPSHDDLFLLYGIDVQELTVWRPLIEHAREHLGAGRLIATEADAWWLPDTAGTDYRRQHTKTTVVLNALDEAGERLGYFHNAGYHQLEGEDFRRTFALGPDAPAPLMPFFAEIIDLRQRVEHEGPALRQLARGLLPRALRRRPADNPVERFARRYQHDLPGLQQRGLAHYHAWAFAATRQLGSAAELAAHHLRWLEGAQTGPLHQAADGFQEVATLAKTFILKGARAVASGRPFADGELLERMSVAWSAAMQAVDHRPA